MTRICWLMTTLVVALLSTGCHREAETPSAATTGKVHIERVKEAEEVLALLGRTAWVYKYRGGAVTAEFAIYHHLPGTNQPDKVIFEANGDSTVQNRQAWTNHLGKAAETSGYLIAAIPEDDKMSNGLITFCFTLCQGGAGHSDGSSIRRTANAGDVYPKTALPPPVESGRERGGSVFGSTPADGPLVLAPGETKQLMFMEKSFSSHRGAAKSRQEVEHTRHVLTVTALKNGQLPKRGGDQKGTAP